jgi:metal-responsive CopG/Arc/MetJ family transcriptional regulator
MPQYTFTSTKLFIEGEIEAIRQKENRTRSEMIDILLRQAVKERLRRKNAKVNIKYNSSDPR